MRMRRLGRAAVVVATVAITGGGILASPASAAEVRMEAFGAAGSYDNNPGNGSQSWVWVWAGNNQYIHLQYEFTDGSKGELHTFGYYTSNTRNLNKDVRRIRLCKHYSPPYWPSMCSAWNR